MLHADEIMRTLTRRYREPAEAAKDTPWKVLLFTALSARTRDTQTEPAFRRVITAYPTPAALSRARETDVAHLLNTIGLFRSKARNIVALAKALTTRHEGRVPKDMDALVALPAVGRKTASCVLVYAFSIPAIAVDTHVFRIANRLGWTKENTPEKTERALRARIPKRHWIRINKVMVPFGREICGRIPKCWMCPVAEWCDFSEKTRAPKEKKNGTLEHGKL